MGVQIRVRHLIFALMFGLFLYTFSNSVERLLSRQTGIYTYLEIGDDYLKFPSLTFCPPWWSKDRNVTNNLYMKSLNVSFIMELMEIDFWFLDRANVKWSNDWSKGNNPYKTVSSRSLLAKYNLTFDQVWSKSLILNPGSQSHFVRCTTLNVPDIFPKMAEISLVFKFGATSMMDIQLEEKFQSTHLFKMNGKSTVRLWPNTDGNRRLVEKKSQLDKRMLIGKGKSECIKQNNHNTSVCINQVVEDLLQCHLPWMKNLNSTLRTCNSTEDFKKYYNILKTKESLVREKCILVQNCIQYDWVIKHIVQGDTGDITNMTELYFAPLSDEVHVTEDYEVYTFTNFIGEVGGYLGLLMGASIPSIYEELSNLLRFWLCKKKS